MTPQEEFVLARNWIQKYKSQFKDFDDQLKETLTALITDTINDYKKHINWLPYPDNKPDKYGKYFICRKDGKVHWETWNGTGFAYNNNEIRYFMEIIMPTEFQK
jgi:hypothetical protein